MKQSKNITRREVIIGGVACVLVVIAGESAATPALAAREDEKLDGQYGFLLDMSKCVACGKCIEACRRGNQLSDDTPDRRVMHEVTDASGRIRTMTTSCMHCGTPSCLRVCPAGAIYKKEGGVVRVDEGLCIGCKYCYSACEYNVPRYNSQSMDKCDCCLGSGLPLGSETYCASACKFGAIKYGLVDDLLTEVKGDVQPIGSAGNPSCYVSG